MLFATPEGRYAIPLRVATPSLGSPDMDLDTFQLRYIAILCEETLTHFKMSNKFARSDSWLFSLTNYAQIGQKGVLEEQS